MDSGYIRVSLGRRLAAELDAKAERGEIVWRLDTSGDALRYVIDSGPAWAVPMPTLRLTPGEAAEWCGIEVTQ